MAKLRSKNSVGLTGRGQSRTYINRWKRLFELSWLTCDRLDHDCIARHVWGRNLLYWRRTLCYGCAYWCVLVQYLVQRLDIVYCQPERGYLCHVAICNIAWQSVSKRLKTVVQNAHSIALSRVHEKAFLQGIALTLRLYGLRWFFGLKLSRCYWWSCTGRSSGAQVIDTFGEVGVTRCRVTGKCGAICKTASVWSYH